MDDRETLLARWQQHDDRDALDALLRLEIDMLKARIRARGRRMLSASASAGDVAQEAVARMLRQTRAPRFESAAAMRAYLWTAAWRLLLNRVNRPHRAILRLDRTRSQMLETALATTGGMGRVEARERSRALDVTLNLLDESDREILDLVYFKGHDLGAVAERLGVSRDAATKRLSRARLDLAKKLRVWTQAVA